jgi:tetratricopeptide (TPR) repeat protein
LGHAYKQEGNLEGALYCWEKALEINPTFGTAFFDLATAYLNTGDKMKAFQLLTDYKRQYFQLMPPVDREKLNALLEKARK